MGVYVLSICTSPTVRHSFGCPVYYLKTYNEAAPLFGE